MGRGGVKRRGKKSESTSGDENVSDNNVETPSQNNDDDDEKMSSSSPTHEKEEQEQAEKGEKDGQEVEDDNSSGGPPPSKKAKKDDDKEDKEEVANENDEGETKKKERSPQLEKFWKAVQDDASDFTAWTYLLQHVDQNSDAETGREAFDSFLHRYPYCYGYWKKYADFEKKKGTPEKCMMVFERGIKAIPLSADLWIHYLNHVKTEYQTDFIRAQYERAVDACGREWRSDKLWDHYVKWEISNQSFVHVYKLYNRIIRNPTQGLSHQFDMFRDFVKEHNPKDILESSEFLNLRKEVLASMEGKKDGGDKGDDEKEDDEKAPGKDDSEAKADEENLIMREKIIFSRRKVFKETEEVVQARWKYEDQIKRPYFHMKPLERGQLKNWSEYLDYEIEEAKKSKDESRVEILFERCLIACALYEEFWIKYIDWICSREGDHTEFVREVYRRVCEHHLPDKIEIHLRRASFEERVGNHDAASEIYAAMENKHPELLSVVLRRINLERRRSNNQIVHDLYKSCLEKKSGSVRSELAVKYARFIRLHLNEEDKAIRVLEEAVEHDESNPKLYLQLLDIHLHSRPFDVSRVIRIFDQAIEKSHHVLMFSQRKVEFIEDFGSDVNQLAETRNKHNELALKHRNNSPSSNNNVTSSEGDDNNREDSKKSSASNGSSSTNSASYEANHNNQYQQYGSRYSSSTYQNYGAGYNGSYYQGYSGSYANSY